MKDGFRFSKIKNIYLPLFDYKFDHGPSSMNEANEHFSGREGIIKRIQLLFSNTQSEHGAYLITGYRGMGKTSVVREALNRPMVKGEPIVSEKENLEVFNFSLSQDEVKEIDLLRQIGFDIIKYARKNIIDKYQIDKMILSIGLKIICFVGTLFLLTNLFCHSTFEAKPLWIFLGAIGGLFSYTLFIFIFKTIANRFVGQRRASFNRYSHPYNKPKRQKIIKFFVHSLPVALSLAITYVLFCLFSSIQ